MSDWIVGAIGIAALIMAVRVFVGGTQRRRERRARAVEKWGRWALWFPERFDGVAFILSGSMLTFTGLLLLWAAMG